LEHKVLVGVSGLVSVLVLVVALALFLMVELREHEARLNERAIPFSVAVAEAGVDSRAAAVDERGFLVTGDNAFLVAFGHELKDTRAALAAAAHETGNDNERRALLSARARFNRWAASAQRGFAAFRSGDKSAVIAAAIGPHHALWSKYERSLAATRAQALDVVVDSAKVIDSKSRVDVRILFGLLVATITIAAGIGIWLVRSVVRPIGSLNAILGREKGERV
jgi:CHASE3 domain sensor protein